MNNTVKFNNSDTAYLTFFKWDYGQVLCFDSVPVDSEVHFPIKESTEVVSVKVIDNRCVIPDSTLTLDKSCFDAWLYIDNGAAGKTKKTIHINLIQRAKPNDHIYNPDENQVLNFNSKLDKYQGTKNKGKIFVVNGEGRAELANQITIDSALSPDSENAIANRAVAEVLDGGKLLGFEVISDYAGYCSFEEHSSKYAAGLTNGGYVVILVTDMVYKDDNIADESQLLLAQGTYILKGLDVILQGVGIKVIQELLDDLDTRYLSYDEWKTVYDLLWSSIQLISESHNKLQEDVENELAKKQDREEWTLLINDTLTQDIATGTKYGWSSDINGNAYSVKELFAEIVFPSELSGNLALQINGADASAIMWGLLPAKTKKVHIHSKMLPDGCIETEYVYKLGSDSEITSHKSLKGINGERRLTAFTKLSISSRPTNGSVALPSGTAVKIWAMK